MSSAMRPALILSRLDADRIEALLDAAKSQSPDHSGLRSEIERARIVEPADMPPDVVTMNSTITLRESATGVERSITLVYPRDADGTGHNVSILAPVGSALIGLKVGDSIDWPMPGGRNAALEVLSIEYQPEAAGDLHR